MSRLSEIYKEQQKHQREKRVNELLKIQYVPKQNEVPIYGNTGKYNLPEICYKNILESFYFHKLLSKTTFEDVVKEGQDTLHDVGIQSLALLLRCLEPWVANTTRTPSTAFCILLKFFMYRLSFDELFKLLRMKNCPHLRAIGFLYIRFAVEPKQLWNWLSPYFDESEEFEPFMDHVKMTMGQYIEKLINEEKYNHDIILPRIPLRDFNLWSVRIQQYEAVRHLRRCYQPGYEYVEQLSVKEPVRALYTIDMKWYPATIKYVNPDHTYIIVYDGYNNSEFKTRDHLLAEGEDIDMSQEDSKKDITRKNRSYKSAAQRQEEERASHHHRHRDRDEDRYNRYKDYDRRNPSRSRSRDSSSSPSSPPYVYKESEDTNKEERNDIRNIKSLDTETMLNSMREKEAQKALSRDKHYCQPVKSYKAMMAMRPEKRSYREEDYVTTPTNETSPRSPEESTSKPYVPDEKMKNLLNAYGASASDYQC